jgi:hypothetical protein
VIAGEARQGVASKAGRAPGVYRCPSFLDSPYRISSASTTYMHTCLLRATLYSSDRLCRAPMGFDWTLLDSDHSCLVLTRPACRVLVGPAELCRALVSSGHSCPPLVTFTRLLRFLPRSDGLCLALTGSSELRLSLPATGYLYRTLVIFD